ncbi:hypothetical protein H0E84_01870 [Luteimonas sp. SJ-92]|uniref:Uncharacterized protein n=1 Tax=Luteimonas salinisoli TaxID=2752307 RepID=A0A853J8L8_9GAMM|nr:hypothetical protein [Luteimonas salinisoli]NZA25122.1 hypothetical protein [Luteimonas salinisoli]
MLSGDQRLGRGDGGSCALGCSNYSAIGTVMVALVPTAVPELSCREATSPAVTR